MNDLTLADRPGLPEALRVLVAEFPRTGWQTHPNFGGMVEFWLQRHLMFRQLTDLLTSDAERLAAHALARPEYDRRLAHYAGTLLNELHGHHRIEDQHYFPRLVGIDRRVERGFDLLESDHAEMDGLLHGMAAQANAVLQGGEAGPFADAARGFGHMLDRHLTDEEDIIVPVILKSGFAG